MQVNFFEATHAQTTNATNFGICDDQDRTPAYIDKTNTDKWVADVRNIYKKVITFHPIDNSVDTLRPDGTMDNRCDGMMEYDNKLIFIELKDRDCQGWVRDGLTQLKSSIGHFEKAHHAMLSSLTIKAQLCNKQRPRAVIACNIDRERFRDETGYIVEINRVITID